MLKYRFGIKFQKLLNTILLHIHIIYIILLVLDDATRSPLLKNCNSELCQLLTKTWHINLTYIVITEQILRFILMQND